MSKCGLGAAVVAVRGPATVGSAKRRVVGCATRGGAASCGPTPTKCRPGATGPARCGAPRGAGPASCRADATGPRPRPGPMLATP
jgi:hypothetical protein